MDNMRVSEIYLAIEGAYEAHPAFFLTAERMKRDYTMHFSAIHLPFTLRLGSLGKRSNS